MHNVRELWLGRGRLVVSVTEAPVDEQEESNLTSFELPQDAPTEPADIDSLHVSIFAKTIITAARGGKLRCIRLNGSGGWQYAFAIRALLPHWVDLEDFYQRRLQDVLWESAARLLRPLLTHASLPQRHNTSTGATNDAHDRRLTVQDVQQLQPLKLDKWPEDYSKGTLELYLQWLKEDETLAGLVADAWNAVVKRGEADLIECPCDTCRPVPSSNDESSDSRVDGEEEDYINDEEDTGSSIDEEEEEEE